MTDIKTSIKVHRHFKKKKTVFNFLFYGAESHVSQASLDLAMWLRVALNSCFPCLFLLSAGITGMSHHVQLPFISTISES